MQDVSTSTLVGPTLVLGNDTSPRVLRQSTSHLANMAQFFVASNLQTDDGNGHSHKASAHARQTGFFEHVV